MTKTDSRDPKTLSDAEWQARLDPQTYAVTRKQGTERAFSHPGFGPGPGMFHCTCCGAPLFEKTDKFDSGCGWPSFTQPAPDAPVGESHDSSLGMVRTEVHCDACAAHLGHVFPDGPGPNGLRYCINGVSLEFRAEDDDTDDAAEDQSGPTT